jgi:hypothetical protein
MRRVTGKIAMKRRQSLESLQDLADAMRELKRLRADVAKAEAEAIAWRMERSLVRDGDRDRGRKGRFMSLRERRALERSRR